jgi:hypothetical protein
MMSGGRSAHREPRGLPAAIAAGVMLQHDARSNIHSGYCKAAIRRLNRLRAPKYPPVSPDQYLMHENAPTKPWMPGVENLSFLVVPRSGGVMGSIFCRCMANLRFHTIIRFNNTHRPAFSGRPNARNSVLSPLLPLPKKVKLPVPKPII